MSKMIWTTQKPEKPGYWWHRAEYEKPGVLKVYRINDELKIEAGVGFKLLSLVEGGEWAGPLPEPEEPS